MYLNKKKYVDKIKELNKEKGIILNLDNPVTIQDKLNWLNIYDEEDDYYKSFCTDKINLHEYSKSKLGKDICIPIIKIYKDIDDINFSELPEKFLLRCNHGSGMSIKVDKKDYQELAIKRQLEKWYQKDYSEERYEFQYHNIIHKIYSEEYIEDINQKHFLYDYKFWCFNGKPKFFSVSNNQYPYLTYYDMDGNIIPNLTTNKGREYFIPYNFDLMKSYAVRLCEDFKFVRVDFHEVKNNVYLNKMVFTPNGNIFQFGDDNLDIWAGNLLKIGNEDNNINHPKIKINQPIITHKLNEVKKEKNINIKKEISSVNIKKDNHKIKLCIIHYNTPKLTECLIKSINKFTPKCEIYIFDNSDKNPFSYRQDNIHYIDNTKGQIINFDEWLKKYPLKFKSTEATKRFGSAKHCYSVEKCMDIINDNFILLDSDILLKKDISELYDEEYISVGQLIKQPMTEIYRMLPFICFINVKMCKQNNVHYFDDNYMHGLYNNVKVKNADHYDTGAGFFIHIKTYKYKEIDLNEYCVHFKGGSWEDIASVRDSKSINSNQWLEKHIDLWSTNQTTTNKKVVYTCISGNYDTLTNPSFINKDWDYICFTDQNFSSDVWKIKEIPIKLDMLSQVKKQRYIKIMAHEFLKDYDISLWIDGNVEIRGDLNEFIKEKSNIKEGTVVVGKHPQRDCIYEEAKACIKMKKDTFENVMTQINNFIKEGFPNHYGLPQTCIMIRYHNDEGCKTLMEKWWEVVKDGSHRDQLAFSYAAWKNENIKINYIDKTLFNCKYFLWKSKHI